MWTSFSHCECVCLCFEEALTQFCTLLVQGFISVVKFCDTTMHYKHLTDGKPEMISVSIPFLTTGPDGP